MNTKWIIFLVVCGLISLNQTLARGQEHFGESTKKEVLNDWVNKITKKIETKKIDFELDKPKEITAIIGLRGWELQVKKFDVPNWLGEIASSKDKFLLGVDYARQEKIKSAIVIFESFIKNYPDSKSKKEAEEAIKILTSWE